MTLSLRMIYLCILFGAYTVDASINGSRENVDPSNCCVSTRTFPDQNMKNCGGTRPTGLPFATRSPVMGQHGMAATSQPLTTQVALDILKKGGNAIDAAIAANAMEGLVEPMMNGLGGDLMAIWWDSKTNRIYGYNGSGRSAKGLSYDDLEALLVKLEHKYIPSVGPLSVSIPGAAKGWCDLHEQFGSLPLSDILAPAISYATNGFPVSQVIAHYWEVNPNASEVTSNGEFPHAGDGFWNTFTIIDPKTGERRPPKAGEIFKNPDLANTYSILANGGCDAFYNGNIAKSIEEFGKISGLHITAEDMKEHHGEWVSPNSTTYRDDYRVFELPPNPQGLAVLQMLNILEGYNLKEFGHNTADYLHAHIEAKKLAFADRAKYYADPDFVKVPVSGLVSKEYSNERRKLIDMNKAADKVDAGTPYDQDGPLGGDTIYLTVADESGTMVSLIQSVFQHFGSRLVVPGTGFPLQSRGSLFAMEKDHANVYAPGKRPFHTIIPGFVTKHDKPWLSFGVMGGNMQPQGQTQVLCNMIDFGMNVQEAGDAARYYHTGSSQPTGQVMTDGGSVQLEAGVCEGVREELAKRGHHLTKGSNSGGYQAIMRDLDQEPALVYHGASEMRKDGQAAGY